MRFSNGDCHILARAIHEASGWPIHAFWQAGAPNIHAFVTTPSGHVIDITGVQTTATLRKRWRSCAARIYDCRRLTIHPTNWQELLEHWGSYQISSHSYRRAKTIAPLLIAQWSEMDLIRDARPGASPVPIRSQCPRCRHPFLG